MTEGECVPRLQTVVSGRQVVPDVEVPLLVARPSGPATARGGAFKGVRLVWLVISMVCVLTLNVCISQVEPFFPTVAHVKYSATHTEVGVVIALMPLVVSFFSFAVSHVCHAMGHFAVLLGGLLLLAASSVAFPLAPRLWVVAIVRVGQGVGAAAVITPIMSMNAVLYPNNANMVMGLVEAATGAGYLVGPVLGGLLYNIGGYSLPFLVTGAGTALLAVSVLLVYIKVREELAAMRQRAIDRQRCMTAEEVEAAGRGGCLKPVILLHSASIAVMSISYGFFGPVLGPEVRRALHGTPLLTGMLFAVGAVAYCFGAPLGGFISEHLTGNRRLICASFLIAAVGLALMGPSPGLPHGDDALQWTYKLTGMALVGLGVAFSVPLVPDMIEAENGRPGAEDTVAALYASMYSIGEVVGPIVGGILTQHFGFPLAATIVAAFLACWACVLLFFGATGCLPWRGGPPRIDVFSDFPGADVLERTWSNFAASVQSMSRATSAAQAPEHPQDGDEGRDDAERVVEGDEEVEGGGEGQGEVSLGGWEEAAAAAVAADEARLAALAAAVKEEEGGKGGRGRMRR